MPNLLATISPRPFARAAAAWRRDLVGHSPSLAWLALAGATITLAACGGSSEPTTTNTGGASFSNNPCLTSSVTLAVDSAVLVDCSNNGTTVTLAGGGANYMVVAQFPTDQVADTYVSYSLAQGVLTSASYKPAQPGASALRTMASPQASAAALRARMKTAAQRKFSAALQAKERSLAASGTFSEAVRQYAVHKTVSAAVQAPPAQGTIRNFRVLSNFNPSSPQFTTVAARLSYVGTSVLVYIDTLAPTPGFSATQLTQFGQLFDQTLYPIDTAAFGPPTDIDNNGHVIMLMSPIVNGDTPTQECFTEGYVAGFFDSEDFDGPSDPNSNQGEVFYSVVPDSAGKFSCPHTVADIGSDVPPVFLHELQHLIDFGTHVVINGGQPGSSWLDEGLSILAEELGSLYYENKYPPPTGRTNPTQLFPDSSQLGGYGVFSGFVSDFIYDGYEYALLPDTASVSLHSDSDDGFSWRGGDWAMMRYLGDHYGSGVFRKLENGPADGITNIQVATGIPYSTFFANFGMALYADSLPGLPRTTVPLLDRFVSRNMRQLWSAAYSENVTLEGSPTADIPVVMPLVLTPIQSDTTPYVMDPGTMSFWRLNTLSGSANVTLKFAAPGGAPLAASLHPQLAIFRLPSGQ